MMCSDNLSGIAVAVYVAKWVGDRHLEGEETFLANYSDGVTELPLPEQLDHFQRQGKVASFLGVQPKLSYHLVGVENGGRVTSIRDVRQSGLRINGGYFIFKQGIFDYVGPGEELVVAPFRWLTEPGELVAYRYDGSWPPMDTVKDKQRLDEMYRRGETPWQVCNRDSERR